ncbi:MAG: exo-alpha-sialidase [Alloprevotella sp.]|nr:exo-alpha-sialidase [Alloprevotella sp.]
MRKMFLLVLIAFAIGQSVCAQATRREIFMTSSDAAIPYRIPAIAQASNGQLICVADYRWNKGDIGWSPELYGSRIDLKYRLSADGRSFGPEHTVVFGSGSKNPARAGFGDATLVADRETGDVLMLCVMGNVSWGDTSDRNPMRVARILSQDNGTTWSEPTEITSDIYNLYDGLQGLFFGSGKMYQSRIHKLGSHYRIYAAMLAKPGGNRVVYSDDFGKTWHALGGPNAQPCPEGDEPKIIELPNGKLLLSSRTDGGRYFNLFSYDDVADGTGSWQEPVLSNQSNNGIVALSNACNGGVEIVRARRLLDNRPVYLLLQSVPFGPQRANVGIYYKELPLDYAFSDVSDLATHWTGRFQVSQLPSAYSEILLLQDGHLAFIYEECSHIQAYTIVHRLLSLEEITNGLYRIDLGDVKQ